MCFFFLIKSNTNLPFPPIGLRYTLIDFLHTKSPNVLTTLVYQQSFRLRTQLNQVESTRPI